MTTSHVKSVEQKTVIVVVSVTGEGTAEDPCRHIEEYFSTDGKLLARVDPWKEQPE